MTVEQGRPSSTSADTRVFQISPKTPHEVLMNPSSIVGSPSYRLAEDMENNARELEGNVDWREIFLHTCVTKNGDTYIGKAAIAKSIAPTLRFIAIEMGWDMNAPEIVYVGGLYFCWVLDEGIQKTTVRVKQAIEGERRFISGNARENTIKKEEDKIERFGAFKSRIEESLAEFAKQKLSNGERYLKILRELLFSGVNPRFSYQRRNKLLSLLREGKIEEAYTVVYLTRTKKAQNSEKAARTA